MTRYTDDDLILKVDGIDLEECSVISVTIKQDPITITKTNADPEVSISDGTLIVHLSPEETAKFSAGVVYIQVRGLTKEGKSWATETEQKKVYGVLQEGVLNADQSKSE